MFDSVYEFFLQDRRKRDILLILGFVLGSATALPVIGPKPLAVPAIVVVSTLYVFALAAARQLYSRRGVTDNALSRSLRPAAVDLRAVPVAPSLNMRSYVDSVADFEGRLNFGEIIRIDAKFTGTILGGTLIVGQTGRVSGTIHVEHLIVSGNIRAVITARIVEAHRDANISGELFGNEKLVIEEGAVWNVRVLSGTAEQADTDNAIA